LDQPIGHTTRLRLYPIRPLWSLGAGWAAVSGGLAVAGFPLSLVALLNLALVWLLADPVLGVIWDVGVGSGLSADQRGIWRRLISPRLPGTAAPVHLLPYTQTGSPGYRLARHLGRLRRWWRETLWPEAGREFATLFAGLVLAALLGAILGRDVLILVLVSVLLSWLATFSGRRDTAQDSTPGTIGHRDIATLWHALGEFGVAWLIGALAVGGPSQAAALLGICYTITYFGLIRGGRGFRLIGASQATAALLLAGLRHPMAAGAAAVLLLPQWGLHVWAARVEMFSGLHPAIFDRYQRFVQPFVLASMLIAALAVGS
jgi:hypothetical protein